MKTIYIVRHAKSSWEYQGIKDMDRPLKKRGINDAYLVSSILKEKILKPDAFITSSAIRALSTAVVFCNNFGFPLSRLKINKSLYINFISRLQILGRFIKHNKTIGLCHSGEPSGTLIASYIDFKPNGWIIT